MTPWWRVSEGVVDGDGMLVLRNIVLCVCVVLDVPNIKLLMREIVVVWPSLLSLLVERTKLLLSGVAVGSRLPMVVVASTQQSLPFVLE